METDIKSADFTAASYVFGEEFSVEASKIGRFEALKKQLLTHEQGPLACCAEWWRAASLPTVSEDDNMPRSLADLALLATKYSLLVLKTPAEYSTPALFNSDEGGAIAEIVRSFRHLPGGFMDAVVSHATAEATPMPQQCVEEEILNPIFMEMDCATAFSSDDAKAVLQRLQLWENLVALPLARAIVARKMLRQTETLLFFEGKCSCASAMEKFDPEELNHLQPCARELKRESLLKYAGGGWRCGVFRLGCEEFKDAWREKPGCMHLFLATVPLDQIVDMTHKRRQPEEFKHMEEELGRMRDCLFRVMKTLVGDNNSVSVANAVECSPREAVLRWLDALVIASTDAIHLTFGDSQMPTINKTFSTNVLYVMLKFCEPFLDVDSPGHKHMERLDASWWTNTSRIVARKDDPRVLQDDEGPRCKHHHPVGDQAHFVTDVFFLAHASLRLFVPATRELKIVATLASKNVFKIILCGTDLCKLLGRFLTLTGIWLFNMLDDRLGHNLSCVCEALPVSVLHNMLLTCEFLMREQFAVLTSTRHFEVLVRFVKEALGRPSFFEAALLRYRMAEMMIALVQSDQDREASFAERNKQTGWGRSRMQANFTEVLVSKSIFCVSDVETDCLIPGLLHLFVEISGVNDGSINKEGALPHVVKLLAFLLRDRTFVMSVTFTATQQAELVTEFLLGFIRLLDEFVDALALVKAVHESQALLANAEASVAAGEEQVKSATKVLAEFPQMKIVFERSDRFLFVLTEFCRAEMTLVAMETDTAVFDKAANVLLDLMAHLCGADANKLKIENAEHYGWFPKKALAAVVQLLASLGPSQAFVSALKRAVHDRSSDEEGEDVLGPLLKGARIVSEKRVVDESVCHGLQHLLRQLDIG